MCQVTQNNEVTPVAAVEEESKEEEEEIGDLSSVLETLGLSDYLSVFETEKIDVESLVRALFYFLFYFHYKSIPALLFLLFSMQLMCTVDDLKEMGIPLGPRKKIAKFVKEKLAKQANILFALYCRC